MKAESSRCSFALGNTVFWQESAGIIRGIEQNSDNPTLKLKMTKGPLAGSLVYVTQNALQTEQSSFRSPHNRVRDLDDMQTADVSKAIKVRVEPEWFDGEDHTLSSVLPGTGLFRFHNGKTLFFGRVKKSGGIRVYRAVVRRKMNRRFIGGAVGRNMAIAINKHLAA